MVVPKIPPDRKNGNDEKMLRSVLIRMYGTEIEGHIDEIIACINNKVADIYRRKMRKEGWW